MQSVTDAIIEAIRVATAQIPGTLPTTPVSASSTASSMYSRTSTINRPSGSSPSSDSGSSQTEARGDGPGPSNVTQASSSGGTKRKFVVPSMFQSKAKRSKGTESKSKSVRYLRDIFCLPQDCQVEDGTIFIPRGSRRSALANKDTGLFGKLEFESSWSAERMRQEICTVFSKPFGLSDEDIIQGKLFKFEYLQRTGAGSRTLCVPSVTTSFEWNGRQVATLAKSGGIIYILAAEDIPVLWKSVSAQ